MKKLLLVLMIGSVNLVQASVHQVTPERSRGNQESQEIIPLDVLHTAIREHNRADILTYTQALGIQGFFERHPLTGLRAYEVAVESNNYVVQEIIRRLEDQMFAQQNPR